VSWLARSLVPQHDGLALVGDPDGSDGLSVGGRQLCQGANNGIPDLVCVVLNPTRFRKVLGELAIREP